MEGDDLLINLFFFSVICELRKACNILQSYIHFKYVDDFLFT